jgi:hypothetical protein
MGAWGTGPFDNDAALDFLGDLADDSADAVADGLRTAMTELPSHRSGRPVVFEGARSERMTSYDTSPDQVASSP